jgi:hypothetical protein
VFRFAERVSIGRDQGATLVLPDRTVSRLHAVVNRHDAQYILVDKGARNRNLVNGQPVRRIVLKSGDEIQIGRYLLVFHLYESPLSDVLSAWPPHVESNEATATHVLSDTQLKDMRTGVTLQERARLVPSDLESGVAVPSIMLGTRIWTLGGTDGIKGVGFLAERWAAGVLAWNGRAHVVERESRFVRLKVNGKTVDRLVVLAPNDVIEIGASKYRYVVDGS